ncbi:RagB/SusD family nutrient uptake outer membrane protein [Sphingobacterium spiritivorum]|uniref:RagB/SusD family nutrient uptake outer membrane protein n=1 Tax=Sphingobacterium spiritivorum TaxID=258 RepID=UPI003DA62249
MKLYISKSILTILVFLFLSGCDSFLNVRPSTSNVNPSTIKDFQEMLNSDSLATSSFILADIMSDDAMMVRSDKNEFYGNAYLWNKSIWTEADNDFMYNSAYTRILQLNILLNKAEKVSTGNPADLTAKNIILAQAKVHRAWFYLQLVNLYGNDYTSGSPQTDPAVPLILNPDAGVKPKRATVKEIYDQIIKDLSYAVTTPDLPAMGQTVIHPGRAAAFALLARTYLYMGNYSAALTNANAALDLKNTLADYNALEVIPVSLLDQKDNRETMLAKMGQDVHYINRYTSSMLGSDEVLDLLTYQDQRRNLSFSMYGNNYISVNGIMTFNYSIGVPEVMLIKAECLA